MIKRFYLYDDKDLFTHYYDAAESPEQPGVFIAPDRSLEVAPVIEVGTWPVAINGVWVNQPDCRGVVWDIQRGCALII